MGKLEHLKALGIKSVILDDGWSPNHGDWVPDPKKFPNGDEDFKRLIKKIHDNGLKVWIWWLPGYIDSVSSLAAQHPDWLIQDKDGSVHPSYALCPAYPPVQEYYKKLVQKFVTEYKLDGLKLDFQEINTAPPCYNPVHHHKDPNESYYHSPDLFKNIYQTAVHYNPDMLIEYCSCGLPPSIFHLPWINLGVTSDPGIEQTTQRIKMYKALMGDDFPVLEEYCGVLAGPMYQLTIGAGGVPGTFSTYLDNYHDKWLHIYQKYQLSKGQYLNLYDIGFDYPEAHVIKKDRKFYYAFYTHPWKQPAPRTRLYRYGTEFDSNKEGKTEFKYPTENYLGKVSLRGLDKNKEYRVFDYDNNKELGIVKGSKPYLNLSFNDYLLLELSPIEIRNKK
jgi:alpha-galactosidase